jgi:ceramide glucosyltransferase
MSRTDRWIALLVGLFCLDRLLKLLAVRHFFRRPPPDPPAVWPSVTIIQPITRGVHDLRHNLRSRLQLDYPAAIQHLWVCDAADAASQSVCQALNAEQKADGAALILVAPGAGALASKIEKLQAALPQATGEILCFIDDDVALRPSALRELLPYLDAPQAGAVFGLACYTNWGNLWSSALSAFVNANVLLSYIPVTYLTTPFTITGHCFALRRAVFAAAGGFDDMQGRIDDDHELARRLARHNLRSLQTPMIYAVDNHVPSLAAYLAQMQRWFVLPRLLMLPQLTRHDQLVTAIGSLGNLLPGLVLLLASVSRSRRALGGLLALLGVAAAIYRHDERRYLGRAGSLRQLAIMLAVSIVAPLQIIGGLLLGDEIQWRGQRLRIGRNTIVEVL